MEYTTATSGSTHWVDLSGLCGDTFTGTEWVGSGPFNLSLYVNEPQISKKEYIGKHEIHPMKFYGLFKSE